jgi:uncharacterized protein YqhQ
MVKNVSKKLFLFLAKQYTSIGGQAVIEGVMMRSPNSFVVAVRKPDGKIRLRKDQWFGLGKKFDFSRNHFSEVSLFLLKPWPMECSFFNYSANIA